MTASSIVTVLGALAGGTLLVLVLFGPQPFYCEDYNTEEWREQCRVVEEAEQEEADRNRVV